MAEAGILAPPKPGRHELPGDFPEIEGRNDQIIPAPYVQRDLMNDRHIAAMAVQNDDPGQAMAQQPGEQIAQNHAETFRRNRHSAGARAKIIRDAKGQTGGHEGRHACRRGHLRDAHGQGFGQQIIAHRQMWAMIFVTTERQ